MSENERHCGYRYGRVLIETDRILNPQFDDAVVYLSGAQIEMLRNVTQYLRRRETYVTEYNPGYYLAPTVEDYDEILAIVADLEETLMGNENVIWGYKDTYSAMDDNNYLATGFITRETLPVPPGYVYVITGITAQFSTGAASSMYIYLTMAAGDVLLAADISASVGVPLSVIGAYPLRAGQYVKVGFNITTQPCHVYIYVSGYKMKVPS